MSELIQRVAKGIFVAADDAHNTWPTPEHPECVAMARLAIQAMRDVLLEQHGASPETIWEYIDEALKP